MRALPMEHCAYCGKEMYRPPSQRKRTNEGFCSVACRSAKLNPEKNKSLMTDEVRAKLRAARLDTGEGKSYPKFYGRHEHRIVAERILGRPLKPGEVVHHIDRNKRNNNPENLMVFPSQTAHVLWHKEHDKEVMPL